MTDDKITEIRELRKQINGKMVSWKIDDSDKDIYLDCILLADPDKIDAGVSVKPYGLTPEQIHEAHTEAWGGGARDIEYFARPEFCMSVFCRASANFPLDNKDLEIHRRMAALDEGAKSSFDEITGGDKSPFGNPLCPYA